MFFSFSYICYLATHLARSEINVTIVSIVSKIILETNIQFHIKLKFSHFGGIKFLCHTNTEHNRSNLKQIKIRDNILTAFEFSDSKEKKNKQIARERERERERER